MTHLSKCFLLTSAILASSPAFAFPTCTFNGKPVNTNDGNAMKGNSGKVTCKDSDSGKLQSISEYKDGKLLGYQMTMSFNGEKTERSVNEKGNSIGIVKKFDSKGNLISEENYGPGKNPGWTEEQGTSKQFYPSGKIKNLVWNEKGRPKFSASYREDGKLTDLMCGDKSYLPDDKKLCGFEGGTSQVDIYANSGDAIVKKLSFLKGERQEITLLSDNKITEKRKMSGSDLKKTEYFENGKPKIEASYKDHKLDGDEKEYHSSGKMIRLTHWNLGQMTDEKTFYLNGQQKSLAEKKEIKSKWYIARKTFFDNGQLQEDGVYIEKTDSHSWMGMQINRWAYEAQVGLHRRFFENGKPNYTETYNDNGELEGTRSMYAEDGSKSTEEEYAKGNLKHRKEWSATGELTVDDEFFEDGSRSSRLKKKNSEI